MNGDLLVKISLSVLPGVWCVRLRSGGRVTTAGDPRPGNSGAPPLRAGAIVAHPAVVGWRPRPTDRVTAPPPCPGLWGKGGDTRATRVSSWGGGRRASNTGT